MATHKVYTVIRRMFLPSLILSGSLLTSAALAQQRLPPSPYLTSGRLPFFLQKPRAALSDRLAKPGKERVTIVGTLTAQGNTSSATMRWELPGRFRLDRSAGARPILANGPGLDLGRSQTALDELEDSIVESLLLDRAESMLYGVAAGNPVRLLGEQVRQSRNLDASTGKLYDVVDVVAKVDARPSSPVRQKRYLFDSFTGLLQRVIYRIRVGPGVDSTIETSFQQWTTVDGYPFPLVTERHRDGALLLRFQAVGHTLGVAAADGVFDNP